MRLRAHLDAYSALFTLLVFAGTLALLLTQANAIH